jgi:integrase
MVQINRLTTRRAETAPAGRHADGAGLYLEVSASGARRWLFVYRWQGKRPEMGLGGFPVIGVARARELAAAARAKLAERINPLDAKRSEFAPKFGEFALRTLDDIEGHWRNQKHRQQWRSTLVTYAKPIWTRPVSEISTEDVLRCLKPIWETKPETASRVRGRMETVLNAAKALGHRSGENPAAWKGHLKNLLPKPGRLIRGHHAAMPYQDVPAFIARLRASESVSALALEFCILTASRTGEVIGAAWTEFEEHTWTVPAVRMKSNRVHRVPLCKRSSEILQLTRQLNLPFVFPGGVTDRHLSNMAMTMLLRGLVPSVTVHGFRSSFRDWAGDCTDHPREVIEAALSHIIGDKAEQAYRRGDALAKRRRLMEDWAAFLTQPVPSVERGAPSPVLPLE